jgi:hypothetical protein
MRPAILVCLILISAGLLSPQEQQSRPIVRAISIKVVATSPQGLTPIGFDAILSAWKSSQVNLSVEQRLDLASIDKAREIIRELYSKSGHAVRVEHSVNPMPPRSVEVVFQVIELCRCN